jgi:hypothetical protein
MGLILPWIRCHMTLFFNWSLVVIFVHLAFAERMTTPRSDLQWLYLPMFALKRGIYGGNVRCTL